MRLTLKQWLYRNGYRYIKKENDEESKKRITHTFMDGGCLEVPEHDKTMNQMFYDKIAEFVAQNEYFPISELRTPVFKYYLDFDIKEDKEVTEEEFGHMAKHIQRVLSLVLDCEQEHYCFVSSCNSKSLEDGKIKSGCHINFPLVRVDSFMARKLRQIIVQYFEQLEDENIGKHSWDEIIDEEVYVGAGLRMIGADKAHKCPVKKCAGKRKALNKSNDEDDYCDTCDNVGYVYEDRRYYPFLILKEDGSEYKKKMNKCKIENCEFLNDVKLFSFIIKKNSIRTHDNINVQWKETLPAWYKPFPITERITKKKNPPKYLEDKSLTEEQKMKISGYSDLERIDSSDVRFIELQKFIRNTWEVYDDLRIRLFKKTGRKNAKHYSYQIQTYNHYCHNIGREHQSQHIWFHIDPQTHAIYQRCFDCTDYISKNFVKLSQKMIKLLFPEQYEAAISQRKLIETNLTEKEKQVNALNALFDLGDLE